MNRLEFIERIFIFYRTKPENNQELMRIYDNALSTTLNVDWEKMYNRILKNTDEKTLPKPIWFIAQFDSCLKPDIYSTPDGLQLRAVLKTGCSYDMETYHENRTLEEIKEQFRRRSKNFDHLEMFDDVNLEWVEL